MFWRYTQSSRFELPSGLFSRYETAIELIERQRLFHRLSGCTVRGVRTGARGNLKRY